MTELWAEQDHHVGLHLLLTPYLPSTDLSGIPGAGLPVWDPPQRIASSIPGSCPHSAPVPMLGLPPDPCYRSSAACSPLAPSHFPVQPLPSFIFGWVHCAVRGLLLAFLACPGCSQPGNALSSLPPFSAPGSGLSPWREV